MTPTMLQDTSWMLLLSKRQKKASLILMQKYKRQTKHHQLYASVTGGETKWKCLKIKGKHGSLSLQLTLPDNEIYPVIIIILYLIPNWQKDLMIQNYLWHNSGNVPPPSKQEDSFSVKLTSPTEWKFTQQLNKCNNTKLTQNL